MNAYSINELTTKGSTGTFTALNSITEARSRYSTRLKTIFLCHSHKDRAAALGLKTVIESQGGALYIDWLDDDMPETPNRETAARIKNKIVESHLFMFLATSNSMTSRWCPWEIGYADGKKPIDSIVIVPTTDQTGHFYGNEYLQLYRRLAPAAAGNLSEARVFAPGNQYYSDPLSAL